jgi:hypothetical protein
VLRQLRTPEMNAQLNAEFSVEEIGVALSQMAPYKSPGPDGFPPCFYQKFWPLIGAEVCKAVLFCLNSGRSLELINATYIALIPKKKVSSRVTDYRPISLCNVIYKLISKVLANRLKKILPQIISPLKVHLWQAGRSLIILLLHMKHSTPCRLL